MTSELIAFSSGILLTLTGAYISYYFQKRHEKEKEKEKVRFEVYMNLMDLSSYYFWITTAEYHNEKTDPRHKKLNWDISFKILDKLRQFDEIEYSNEILEILFSEKFDSAKERYDKLGTLLDKLHILISPKFIAKIRKIGEENRKIMLTKPLSEFNAPGSSRI